MGITNATIVGGVYQLASWLPATYIQVCTRLHIADAMALHSHLLLHQTSVSFD